MSEFERLLDETLAVGPVDSDDWNEMVEAAAPDEDGAVAFVVPGSWFPDTSGFNDYRGHWLLPNTPPRIGVLAITDASVLFMQWNAKAKVYETLLRLPLSDVTTATIDSYGRARWLVVKTKDYRSNSFEITGKSGATIDREGTEKAAHFISSRVSPSS